MLWELIESKLVKPNSSNYELVEWTNLQNYILSNKTLTGQVPNELNINLTLRILGSGPPTPEVG